MDADTVQFSKERFNDIKSEMEQYVKKIGFSLEKTQFVPVSGWSG